MLTDSLTRKYVQNCRVYRTIQIHPNQDHRLLVTKLVVPTDKTARFVKHKTKSQNVDNSDYQTSKQVGHSQKELKISVPWSYQQVKRPTWKQTAMHV